MEILRKLNNLSSALLIMSVAICASCSSVEKFDSSTPEGLYKIGEAYEADDRFEEAIVKFSEVKNKHPYSRFAAMAELKVADVQFKRESFIEAQFAYQTFKDLHPKHPQIAYVTFRLGLSYFNQLPSSIDRDLSLADKAILYFDEVLTSYGQSEFVNESREKKAATVQMLTEKELYIANFYMLKRLYDSALGRFESLLKTYPGSRVEPQALFGAASAAKASGDRDKIVRYVKMLIKQYPESSEAHKARSEFSDVR